MKMSEKNKLKASEAIHEVVRDLRMELELSPKDDFKLAQVGRQIWIKQKSVLGLD